MEEIELGEMEPKQRIDVILNTLDQAARRAEMGQGPLNPAAVREATAQLRTALRQKEIQL